MIDQGGRISDAGTGHPRIRSAAALLVVVLAACGGDAAPVAHDQHVFLDEDATISGTLTATDLDGSALTYAIATPPAHGKVILDGVSGAFAYRSAQDYNGPDGLTFVASDGGRSSLPATVSITVNPVNDPPKFPFLPDLTNSPETRESFIALPTHDVDGDLLEYRVDFSDADVAGAVVDPTGTLVLTPGARGSTTVTLHASDGLVTATASFQFTATDVTKLRRWSVDDLRGQAVSLLNTLDREVAFELRHNGALLATSGDQLVEEVRALAEETPGEPFERKLWRFVRDGNYHFWPLTGASWQHDPLLFFNSVGFGLCDDVAAVYAMLAKHAGYVSRVWGLNGHVVPEVWVESSWQMYDPDLAVYYVTRHGGVAGVADLAANPVLITQPIISISRWSFPYSSTVADIYGPADNVLAPEAFYVPPNDTRQLRLPAGARITYPGRWTADPVTIEGTAVPATAQLRLDLPQGFSGVVDWPLVLWDVQGSGLVRINGVEYAAGSAGLTAALQDVVEDRPPSNGIEVVGEVSLVYLVNSVRFSLTPLTEIQLRALEAWALTAELTVQDQEFQVGYDTTDGVMRYF